MRYKDFGRTDLKVSEIGFGTARLGGVFAQGNAKQEALAALRQAYEQGITFFDTADMYSQGESESLLGLAFRQQRDQVVIASKGGYCLPTKRRFVNRIKPFIRPLIRALGLKRENLPASVTGTISQDFSADYLIQAVENSLRRLKTDYIDLYQLHSPPAQVVASGEFLEPLEKLKRQGKIRYYGAALDTVDDALLCLQYPEISSLQFPFGLLDQAALDSLVVRATAQEVGLIARGAFGGGLLKPGLTEAELQALTPKWPKIVAFQELAVANGRSLLEMALQFSLSIEPITVTLLGMRHPTHLQSNLQFWTASPLSTNEKQQLLD